MSNLSYLISLFLANLLTTLSLSSFNSVQNSRQVFNSLCFCFVIPSLLSSCFVSPRTFCTQSAINVLLYFFKISSVVKSPPINCDCICVRVIFVLTVLSFTLLLFHLSPLINTLLTTPTRLNARWRNSLWWTPLHSLVQLGACSSAGCSCRACNCSK